MNNPLEYTDPDGEWINFVIGGVVGAATGYITGRMAGLRGSDLTYYTIASAAIGVITSGIGNAVSTAVSVGTSGFIAGATSGAISGTAAGFVAGAGYVALNNTLYSQNNSLLEGGLIGAGFGSVTGFVIGGVVGGVQAKNKGGDFWTGSGEIDEYKISDVSSNIKQAKIRAKLYNGSDRQKTDTELLHLLTSDKYGIVEGDMGISKLTTETGSYGLSKGGAFINSKGNYVGGYVKYGGILNPTSEVHISSWALQNNMRFEATVGHELIHIIHYNLFGLNFNRNYSEAIAYQYSANVYFSYGNFIGGSFNYLQINQWADLSSIPSNYFFHTPLWWP